MTTTRCRCPQCACDGPITASGGPLCSSCAIGAHTGVPDVPGRNYDVEGPGLIWRTGVRLLSRRQARADARVSANSLGHDLGHFNHWGRPGRAYWAECRRCAAGVLIHEQAGSVSGTPLEQSCPAPRWSP